MMVKNIIKWIDDHLEESIIIILLAAMTVVMFAQVVARYLFNNAFGWAEEFCRYCFVYSGFFSIGYCIKKQKMLKVDILMELFPKAVSTVLDLLGRVVTLLYFAYMAYWSVPVLQTYINNGMEAASFSMPMYWVYGVTLVGCILGVIRQIQDLIEFFKMQILGKECSR